MSKFTMEAKVGIFVLLGIFLVAYMSYRVGGLDIGGDKGYEIVCLFDSATGLKKDGQVQIAGINVGTIKEISLEGNRAKVVLNIDSKVALPVDSKALIRTMGVLGDKYVEIVPGTVGAPELQSGERVANTRAPADIDQIITKVASISDDIKSITGALEQVIGGKEGAGELRRIVGNFAEMSENLAKLTRDNQESLNKMIENLTLFAEDLRGMSSANKDNINAILSTFRDTSQSMKYTIASLQDITGKIQRGEGTVGALVNDDTTVQELNSTLASLKDISRKINEGEGTIGKLVNDTATADKLDEALTGVNDYLAKNDQFKIYVDYHGDYLTKHKKLKSYLDVRIQPAEDKYYLIGIVSDPRGVYEREDRTITVNGQPYNIVDEKYKRGDLKFNAQIARRFHDLVLRGGLFESAGGFGLDYFVMDDDLKFTFEAFTGDFDRAAHLRFAVSYDFWNVFYATAGYDDIISDQGRESPFVGLGLKINDDDLKNLLGSIPLPGS